MAEDPYRVEALAREALVKAEAANHLATVVGARFEERGVSVDRQFSELRDSLRTQREEAKEEHDQQQRGIADFGRKIDALAISVGHLESAGATRMKERELSTTVRVSLIGLAGILGGGSITAVVTILGNH